MDATRTSGTPATTPGATDAAQHARSKYIPALDGIRTLAVVAVVLYHLHIPWMQGGLLGVTMFFVISGYIITRLLLNEFSSTGRIDLKSFWIRRARRLLPAIFALITVTIILCAAFNHVMLTKMRPDILPSLLFFNNWWQIIQNVSYFEAVGDPSPLTHFWSLAIEEQFYLVWPVVLFTLLSTKVKRAGIRRGVMVAAAASAVAMAVLYNPGADPSRVYYGTDTRMFSLLLGAWLAFIPVEDMRPRRFARLIGLDRLLKREQIDRAKHAAERFSGVNSMDIVGGIGLAGLLALFIWSNGYSSFQYRGGMLLCSVLTLMLIASCVQEDGILVKFFSLEPLVWLGKRSYSIYLWHFPLLTLMNPVADISQKPWWATVLQLLVVLAVAEASYRFIETPFRHGLAGKAVASLRAGEKPVELARRHKLPVAATGVAIITAAICLIAVPETSALSKEGAALLEGGPDATQEQASDSGVEGVQERAYPEGAFDVLMIGDSVSLRTIPVFEETFPHGHIDAMKNRQFTAGIDLLDGYLANNQVGKVVVIALGTNGLVTDDNIDAIMDRIGDKRIAVFITTRSPQPWVAPTNDAIQKADERYDNVRIIDWFSYSEGRNELFDGDGTHLSSEGTQQYIQLVYDTVRPDLPIHPEDHVDQKVVECVGRLKDALGTGLAKVL